MNKITFIITTVFLLAASSADSQWYQKRYSVTDINQLNQQQLTESFLRARGGTRAGALVSGAGAIGIIAGIIMFNHESPYSGDIEINTVGVLLLGVSIPIEIGGLTIWAISGTRLQSIRAVMNNTQVSLGIMNYSPNKITDNPNYSALPCISVTYRF